MRLILNLQPYSLGIVCCRWSLEEVPYGLVSIFSADDFECNSRFTAGGRRCQNPTQLDKDHLDLNLSAFLSLLPSIILCSSLEYCSFSPRVFLMSELYFLGLVSLPFHILFSVSALWLRSNNPDCHPNLSFLEELCSYFTCRPQYVWSQLSWLLFLSITHSVLSCAFGMFASECLLASSDLPSDCIPK